LAASWAANGVPFLAPLKPDVPELAQQMVLPFWSVMVTTVLLKVDWMWATAWLISFLAFFLALACGI
jgi:hypothetical protein